MEVSVQAIEYHLKEIETENNFFISELSEKLALLNLSRLEKLISVYWPNALTGDSRALRSVLDIMKAQVEWQKQVVPQQGGDVTVNIERFEQTITGNNPLYDLALDNLQDDWMGRPEADLNELYNLAPAVSLDKINDRITKLEAQQEYESEPDESD